MLDTGITSMVKLIQYYVLHHVHKTNLDQLIILWWYNNDKASLHFSQFRSLSNGFRWSCQGSSAILFPKSSL